MKIVFLLTWADAVGGTERVILRQAGWLAQRHEVEVVSVLRTKPAMTFEVDPKVRMTFLVDATGEFQRPIRGGLDEQSCRALAATPSRLVDTSWESAFNALADIELERHLADTDADVVVSSTPALLAVAASLTPHTVVVHEEHRVAEMRGSSAGPYRLFAPRADALVLLSERTRNWFAATLRDSAPRLEVIPNALERAFRPRSSRETNTIVWAGRINNEKQPLHAVQAFAAIARDHPEWVLRFYGDGPKAAAVRREADVHHLGTQVQLMGISTVMEQEWAKASICLLTSRNEAFPLALLEAEAAGVPVVAYDCPNGPGELVRHGETGFLTPPDNIEELAAALRKLVEDVDLRHQLGVAAAEFVAGFDLDVIMERWERLFQELAADRATPGWRDRKLARWAAFQASGTAVGAQESVSAVPAAPSADIDAWSAKVEATVPDLVWSAAQLTRVRDDLSSADVAYTNLEVTADALERAGIGYTLVREPGTAHRVAVAETDRAGVLAALAVAGRDRPTYVDLLSAQGRVLGACPATALPSAAAADTAPQLRVYEPVITSSRTLRLGPACGCSIEFWTRAEDGDRLLAPVPSPIGASVPTAATTPATLDIRERRFPTIEAFLPRFPNEICFPIDVVYTWVDGGDPNWRARRAAAEPPAGPGAAAAAAAESTAAAAGDARYRNRGELLYSLRSLDLFAPWVNHIWIVTDDQVPDWLDTTHPRVSIVDHRDIFTDRDALPTFNSHAIESQLHHIDGLAEHFLYFNDDIFIGRAVLPDLFFSPGGLPKFFPSPTQIDPTPVGADDDFNFTAAKNNRSLLQPRYGRTLTHGMLHAPHSLRRSILADMEAEFAEAWRQTMFSTRRSRTDVSVASSFAHYYGLFTGRAISGSLQCAFVNVGLREHWPRLHRLLAGRGSDVFCLNDFHDGEVSPDEQDRVIDTFLSAYFPVPSQFERDSVRNRQGSSGKA